MKRLVKKSEEEKEMIELYHGTSDFFYKDIKENGLQGINQHGNKITEQNVWGMDVVSRDGVYLTDEIDLAEDYAVRAVSKVGGDKMIVTVQVDVNKLRKDDDFETLMREVDGGYIFDIFDTFISEEEYENTPYGLLSLKAIHCCYHDGFIPKEQIVHIDSYVNEEDLNKESVRDKLWDNKWNSKIPYDFWQKDGISKYVVLEDDEIQVFDGEEEIPVMKFSYDKADDFFNFINK